VLGLIVVELNSLSLDSSFVGGFPGNVCYRLCWACDQVIFDLTPMAIDVFLKLTTHPF
jgi:hypothetical protein